jgi:hypothetical protein
MTIPFFERRNKLWGIEICHIVVNKEIGKKEIDKIAAIYNMNRRFLDQ